MAIHRYITIFDILIQPKCVSIQHHCLMYRNMTIYRYIVASLTEHEITVGHLNTFEVDLYKSQFDLTNV